MNEYIQEKKDAVNKILKNELVETMFSIKFSELIGTYIQEAYNRGVEDSLKCVPERKTIGTDEYPYDKGKVWGWNECRQQTIDNISKLLNNK